MSKVQSDFLFKWLGERASVQTFGATETIPDTIEIAFVEGTTGAFNLTLPLVVDPLDITQQITTTRQLLIVCDANVATNNVTLLANGTGITIEDKSSFVLDTNNQIINLKLIANQWLITANTDEYAAFGVMGYTDNATDTVIVTVDTYTDIAGTIVSGDLKRFTFSGDTLTYTGWQTREFRVSVNFSLKKALGASAREIRAALFLDTGSGFVEQGSAPMDMDNNLKSFGFNSSRELSTNDKFHFQIKNTTNNDDILIVTFNVVVSLI